MSTVVAKLAYKSRSREPHWTEQKLLTLFVNQMCGTQLPGQRRTVGLLHDCSISILSVFDFSSTKPSHIEVALFQ